MSTRNGNVAHGKCSLSSFCLACAASLWLQGACLIIIGRVDLKSIVLAFDVTKSLSFYRVEREDVNSPRDNPLLTYFPYVLRPLWSE